MKSKLALFASAVLLICTAAGIALAQHGGQDSVTFGTVELKLGMPESAVLEKLGAYYELSSSGPSAWLIKQKGKPGLPIGSLNFKQGALIVVMKYWAREGAPDTGVVLADNLFAALHEFEQEGRTTCRIETGNQPAVGGDQKAIFITCGAKYLRIDIARDDQYGNWASIAEVLEVPRTN